MKNPTTFTNSYDLETFRHDAKALLAATANMAEEKVVQARERLAEALEQGKDTWLRAQHEALEGARSVDQKVRSHPYQALGMALGVGAILGAWLARRS
jgi:ElaB/YqjD/DUF883 family membrane-anchored ribosome-binding protein